ncbi:uncharacterized protein DFL_004549 [Arthrobotrys flagrans]|uniref:Uncharacterized protein n=1 Tax=Arthrobotrys flagrans TaxID=97331 RepID=A0A437A4Y1_ARTFL|nr:hypothetical protein DFL_004549 [Arthrobotrys flagrans]
MKSRSYVGPVTSLAFLGDDLFVGHGLELKFFTLSSSQPLLQWRKRIFKRERIQGIQLSPPTQDGEPVSDANVLLWGGKRFQILQLADLMNPSFNTSIEEEIPAPDWILHSVFLEPDGKVPRIAMMTAHNTILTYRHDQGIELASRYKWYPSPERCLLYSATLFRDSMVQTSDNLVAIAGTVFGEVLLWKLDTTQEKVPEKVELSSRYLSHEGSVFGVSISPEFSYAASCSDDRTIRVWDIEADITGSEGCREVKEPLAIGWGHQARIWGVRFLQAEEGYVRIISFSEDLTAKVWSMRLNGSKSLICTKTFKNLHSASGKNIWSLAVHPSERRFVTGGADSGIASWNILEDVRETLAIKETVANLEEILPPPSTLGAGKPTKDEPRKYVALGSRSFIVAMSSGWLLHCNLSQPGIEWQKVGFWPRIKNMSAMGAGMFGVDGTCNYVVALGDNTGKVLLQTWRQGLLLTPADSVNQDWIQICDTRPSDIFFSRYQNIEDPHSVYAAVTTFKPDTPIQLLKINVGTAEIPTIAQSWSLIPPDTFPFTAILVYACEGRIFCLAGSRHGAFALYSIIADGSTINPLKTWRHVHDDESITSLALKGISSQTDANASADSPIELLLTSTGRSGAYKSHKLFLDTAVQEYELFEINAVYPAAVPRVENYHKFTTSSTAEYEIIYGFRGRDFVLWNQTLGLEAASYDCEGGNRSWDFSFGADEDAQSEGLFVFTKSKKCYVVEFKQILRNPLLQTPFHGREVKTLAISSQGTIATGAEDTIIRLSSLDHETNQLLPLAFRKTHTTGLQDLVWSPCGGWLFSSGSVEEVYSWKINAETKLQSGTVGMLREAVYEVSTENLPDLRVCGLDATTIYTENGDHYGFLVGMVRSDSSIKLALYDIAGKKFTTIAEGHYKTSCLLQIRFHLTTYGGILIITAGTDGHVTFWDITETMSTCGVSAKPITSSDSVALSLNGPQASTLTPAKLRSEQWILSQPIHQNSIKVLEILNREGSEILLLTGGDDTAISVSRVICEQHAGKLGTRISGMTTRLLERAHASAVTALAILSTKPSVPNHQEKGIEFLSSGVDQQVKKWCIKLGEDTAIGSVEVVEDIYVSVPDVSSLALIDTGDNTKKLVVGGVGVEVLEL